MSVRRLEHPRVTICDDEEGLSLEFLIPSSKFGAVEIILSEEEADSLAADIQMALAFSSSGGSEE